ncbi:ATP synthase gamma chain 1, chloroplastic [Vitis vinifera]|uniref:F-ATPase gamma subunit n=1 Tax=Vitis vinifera TaxID=29760 RepID=A0A438ISB1_VITVI|nr:ATP synthase gamma chain 1, chloroplastic [Vitis vinifera]
MMIKVNSYLMGPKDCVNFPKIAKAYNNKPFLLFSLSSLGHVLLHPPQWLSSKPSNPQRFLFSFQNPFRLLPCISPQMAPASPLYSFAANSRAPPTNRFHKEHPKITEAMKLVAAAKVRRAQEAVINGRPFSNTLVEVLHYINEQLQDDGVSVPLTESGL